MKCPHCQKEFNAGKLMGSAKTPAKTAAAKARGEIMRVAFANHKKQMEAVPDTSMQDRVNRAHQEGVIDGHGQIGVTFPQMDTRVMPKGALTKDDLKAMMRGTILKDLRSGMDSGPLESDLSNTPHAPFDLNLEGEPHRVRQIGKKLMLVYLGNDGETPIRPLAEGELEKLWDKRIIK